MTYNYIIIEDEKGALENLMISMENHSNFTFLETATNIKDGLAVILKHKPDLIFLDVELGDERGFELIEKLRQYYIDLPFIIMTTAHDHYGKEAVNNGVMYFLSKPIDPDELQKSLIIFEQTFKKQQVLPKFIVRTVEEVIVLDYSSIIYMQAEGNYTRIYKLKEESNLITKTLKHFEYSLPSQFLRIHKSHIINTTYLKSYSSKDKLLILSINKDDIVLPIGKTYFNVLKHFFD